jgi:hypothetical protein
MKMSTLKFNFRWIIAVLLSTCVASTSSAATLEVEAGLLAEFKVFVTIAWIIGGLFIANTIIPPSSKINSLGGGIDATTQNAFGETHEKE